MRKRLVSAVAASTVLATLIVPAIAFAHGAAHCKPQAGVGPFDPITLPGQTSGSHSHTFLGNKYLPTHPKATYAQLVGKPTACDVLADSAAYWVPTLYKGGTALPVDGQSSYYRDWDFDNTDNATTIKPHPADARLIAGNAQATSPQPNYIVWWSCSDKTDRDQRYTTPEEAACNTATPLSGSRLTMHITFPSCWDGKMNPHAGPGNTADFSGSHAITQHFAYPVDAEGNQTPFHPTACPAGYPTTVPSLTLAQRYAYNGDGSDITISGNIYSLHADFWNTWVQRGFTKLIDLCIQTDLAIHPHGNAAACGG